MARSARSWRSPRPLVILAEKVDGAALGMLVQNNQHGTMEATAIRAPGFGHRRIAYLEDLAAFTGGQVITAGGRARRSSTSSLARSARARRVIVTEDDDDVHRGRGHRRGGRGAAERRSACELERATQERDIEVAQERRARLVEPARRHPRRRRDRRRARQGAPPHRGRAGGDAARRWPRASCPAAAPRCCGPRRALDDLGLEGDYAAGVDVVRRVLGEPLFWIASNAGYDGQAVVDQVRAMPDGRRANALTGEFGDLIEQGVIDPVRVTRLSLQHAASVAALMLTTEAVVAEELIAQPGAIIAPGFGDLAEGLARPSSPV